MTKKRTLWWLAPLTVLVLMSVVYLANGLFPFGKNTISWCDMNQQVVPLLMDFKDILLGKSSMLFNLQNAGGMNFWGVFLFFLSSPFSFLVLLVPKADFYLLMNVMVALKMACSAWTAGYLFRRFFPKMDPLAATAFSVMYACSGFTMMYFQNLVWLDTVCLFPLFLIGLRKLFLEKKLLPYILSFSALLVVHFYLSYMIVMWLVLASGIICFFMTSKEQRGERIFLLGAATLAVLLLTGIIWLPALMQFLESGRGESVVESISSGSLLTRWDTTLPVLTCTGMAVAAIPLTILEKKRTDLHKVSFILFVLLLIPLFIDPINKMWHTGSYQAFPVRYGFILVLMGLLAAACSIEQTDRSKLPFHTDKDIFGVSVGILILIGIAASWLLSRQYENLTIYVRTLWMNQSAFLLMMIFAVLAAALYFLLGYFYRHHAMSKRFFCVILCLVTLTETFFYAEIFIASPKNNGTTKQTVTDLEGKIDDDSLYRLKMDKKYFDVNLIGGVGYPSLSHYTSLTDGTYLKAIREMGYSGYWMEVNSNGGTALSDALFGNRYSVLSAFASTDGREKIYSNEDYQIVKENFTMPFGTVISNLGEPLTDRNRFEIQNDLYHTAFGTKEDLFTQYQPDFTENVGISHSDTGEKIVLDDGIAYLQYQISVKGTQTLYFDCFQEATNALTEPVNGGCAITVNGKIIRSLYPTSTENGILNLGTFTDETVQVKVKLLHSLNCTSFGVYGMDCEKLQNAIQSCESCQDVNFKESKNGLSGTVYTAQDGYLFLPIRGGKGFTAQVNGNPVNIDSAFGAFLAIPVTAGENQVTVTYWPSGFRSGVIVSILGLFYLIPLLYLHKRKTFLYLKLFYRPAEWIFAILCIGVVSLLYIAPVAVWIIYS